MLKVRLHVFRMQVQGFTGMMDHARSIPAGAAQDQRRDGVVTAAKAQIIELEQRQICLLAGQQLAEIADDPMAPEPRIIRYRHELERLRALIDGHDDGEPNSDD